MTLYDEIGHEFISKAIREFYSRAFKDSMICHFFMNSDFEHLVAAQTQFAIAMLDGPKEYRGKSLDAAHQPFQIRPPHFGRRQVIMGEVLQDLALSPRLQSLWLDREEKFKSKILRAARRT